MLTVDRVIQLLHFGIGNLVCELIEGKPNLRMLLQRLLADHRHRFVRREIVTVIREHEETECRDKAVGRIASRKINLSISQRARQQSQVHNARRFGKMQAVSFALNRDTRQAVP